MTKEIIDQPNPAPLQSHLPDYVTQLSVALKLSELPEEVYNELQSFRKAACYIAAGIYP